MVKANGEVTEAHYVIVMKGTLRRIESVGLAHLFGQVVIFIAGNTKMKREMATVKCNGLMVVFTKENG
jgi:hypothetical protein